MNLGFIILAHNLPDDIGRLADILTKDGNRVVIHFDLNASREDREAVAAIASANPDHVRVISKVHCVWGEWSLVEAVLLALREFTTMPAPPDYVHLMSAADFPIRPIADLKEFLCRNPGKDFVECYDITRGAWVKGGLSKERFRFYFPFNFRTHRKAFDRLVRWQRKLKIRRRMPLRLRPYMGSQWWTLRWSTCLTLLDFGDANPKVRQFFKSTWIPDESYFQTLIGNLIPPNEVVGIQMTFHHLTPTGRPYIFYNDHLPLLQKLPHFFVRKVSPCATVLREKLLEPGTHRSRIPTPELLGTARDLVRNRIDANHQFSTSVAGHTDFWFAPELRAEKRPLVLLFLTEDSQLPYVEDIVMANPHFRWLGRPFARKAIDTPAIILARMGLTRASWEVRDHFRQQFLHYLLSSAFPSEIPIAVVRANVDRPDLEALNLLGRMLPLLVKTRSLKSLTEVTGFLSANAAFMAKIFTVDLQGIKALLDGLPLEIQPVTPANRTESADSITSSLKKTL